MVVRAERDRLSPRVRRRRRAGRRRSSRSSWTTSARYAAGEALRNLVDLAAGFGASEPSRHDERRRHHGPCPAEVLRRPGGRAGHRHRGRRAARCSRSSVRTARGRPPRWRSSRGTAIAPTARSTCWGSIPRAPVPSTAGTSASCCSPPGWTRSSRCARPWTSTPGTTRRPETWTRSWTSSGSPGSATNASASSPAGSSVGSTSPSRSPATRSSCSSTSPRPASTRTPGVRRGRSCGTSSRSARRSSSRRTSWTRRRCWPTAWR